MGDKVGKCKKIKLILACTIIAVSCLSVLFFAGTGGATQAFTDTVYRDTSAYSYESTVYTFTDKSISDLMLIPGGFPFGVKFYTRGVVVVGLSDVESENGFLSPADSAGFKKGDIITAIGGCDVNTIEEISSAIEQSQGKTINFSVSRAGEIVEINLTPVKAQSDGKYKSGMWIRDSTAGIGTVTFIDPETLSFGGLGHGICDSDTGTLMPLARGNVVNVEITDIVRGAGGRPGELKGSFGAEKAGVLTGNTSMGVFGMFSALPEKAAYGALPVASKNQIAEGKAQIYSSIKDGENKIYEIEITKINPSSSDAKNFIIKVVDPSLIELTGGIVQGMSGSPIIQNGRIIGAVTHVFVNDPTKGYGIFIENMLSAAENIQ